MKLRLYEGMPILKKQYEIECDSFRELYDIISWLGGWGFPQYNGNNVTERRYEFHIRDNDRRLFRYDRQRETNTIELQRLEDMLIIIEL